MAEFVVKESNYILCPSCDIICYSEEELLPIYSEAVTKFNMNPKSARTFLASKKVFRGVPDDMANFIIQNPKLSKRCDRKNSHGLA